MSFGRRRQSRLVSVGVLCEVCRGARAATFRSKALCSTCGRASSPCNVPSVSLGPASPALAFCAICDAAPAIVYCAPAAAALCAACDARVHIHANVNDSTCGRLHIPIHDALVTSPVCFAIPGGCSSPLPSEGGSGETRCANEQTQAHGHIQGQELISGQFPRQVHKLSEHDHVSDSTVAAAAAAAAAGELYLLSASAKPADHEYRQILANVTAAASAAARSATAVLSRTNTLPPIAQAPKLTQPLVPSKGLTKSRADEISIVPKRQRKRRSTVSIRGDTSGPSVDEATPTTTPTVDGGKFYFQVEDKGVSHSQIAPESPDDQEQDLSAVVPIATIQTRGTVSIRRAEEDQGVPDVGGFESLDLSQFDR